MYLLITHCGEAGRSQIRSQTFSQKTVTWDFENEKGELNMLTT